MKMNITKVLLPAILFFCNNTGHAQKHVAQTAAVQNTVNTGVIKNRIARDISGKRIAGITKETTLGQTLEQYNKDKEYVEKDGNVFIISQDEHLQDNVKLSCYVAYENQLWKKDPGSADYIFMKNETPFMVGYDIVLTGSALQNKNVVRRDMENMFKGFVKDRSRSDKDQTLLVGKDYKALISSTETGVLVSIVLM